MIVWDRGQWEPEGDPQEGLAKGHLAFTLDGAQQGVNIWFGSGGDPERRLSRGC